MDIPRIGDTIRTKKMQMEGEVVKLGKNDLGWEEVYFKVADGRIMKTPLSNVTIIQKLEDGSMGGINRSHPGADVSYEKVLDEVIAKWDEAKKETPVQVTQTVDYHGWEIRYRDRTSFTQWAVFHKGELKHKDESASEKEAIHDAQSWINSAGQSKEHATDKVTIDFNAAFAREIGSGKHSFYATITNDVNTPKLIISLEPQKALKKSASRLQKHKETENTTNLPMISLSSKESNDAGLQPNGRYILGDKEIIDNNTIMFPLIYQSTVQGKGDMQPMKQPGLTVAHNRV
jgi:hypothetical protein